ncbi:GDYXXLXY domain-containing protein [Rhodoflexus sp.]
MKNFRLWHLIAFQVLILVGMFVKAYYPLWAGEEVVLRVVPRDPRDIFRGDYVALNYAFSTICLDSLPNDLTAGKTYHFGDALYLTLKKEGNFHVPAGLYQNRPEGVLFLRVMPSYSYTNDKSYRYINLTGGIESYFTNSEQAQKLENMITQQNSDSVTVSVAVAIAADGAARIKRISF